MMNAQDRWKSFYFDFKMALKYSTGSSDEWRMDMWKARREAALERKLAAAQRTIEAQTMRINGVLRICNDGAEMWQHVFDEETASCAFCGYDWPCEFETIRRALLGLDDQDMRECRVPSDRIEISA